MKNAIRNISFFIVGLSLIFDTLAGLIRFYFDKLGFPLFVYIPKMLLVILIPFLFLIVKKDTKKTFVVSLFLFYLIYSFLVTNYIQVLFGIYMYSMLLVAYFLALNSSKPDMEKIYSMLIVIFLIAVTGVCFNFFYDFPWEGYKQEILGKEIEANREWYAFGIKRHAGFGRLSATTAITIGITGLVFISKLKNRFLKLLVWFVSLIAIFITTTKTTFIAFFISSLLYIKIIKNILPIPIFISGFILPIYSISTRVTLNLSSEIMLLLVSFEDRLLSTWPNFMGYLMEAFSRFPPSYFFGLGIGSVGTAALIFGERTLSVADNMLLYLFGQFGLLGVLFLFYLILIDYKLLRRSLYKEGAILFFIMFHGVTTDMFENLIVLFVIGYILGLYSNNCLSYPEKLNQGKK